MKRNFTNQKAKVLYHLANGGPLTRVTAMTTMNISNLPTRIHELRHQHDVDIHSTTKYHPVTGQRYVAYWMTQAEAAFQTHCGTMRLQDGEFVPTI